VHIRIVDADGRTCSAGTEGEVWVLGPTVARGYLGNPAETSHSFVVGWFRTGDLGAIDQDGYLFLTGRIKNIINRGGEKISPEHVEDVLAGCRGVTEAAVFAIPDATFENESAQQWSCPRTSASDRNRSCKSAAASCLDSRCPNGSKSLRPCLTPPRARSTGAQWRTSTHADDAIS
jgi:acyl-CoA synthetase (AMP-forming)/AMP-acid ligase II